MPRARTSSACARCCGWPARAWAGKRSAGRTPPAATPAANSRPCATRRCSSMLSTPSRLNSATGSLRRRWQPWTTGCGRAWKPPPCTPGIAGPASSPCFRPCVNASTPGRGNAARMIGGCPAKACGRSTAPRAARCTGRRKAARRTTSTNGASRSSTSARRFNCCVRCRQKGPRRPARPSASWPTCSATNTTSRCWPTRWPGRTIPRFRRRIRRRSAMPSRNGRGEVAQEGAQARPGVFPPRREAFHAALAGATGRRGRASE